MTGTDRDAMDRLAESVIDEVLRSAVVQRQRTADRTLAGFASARRDLAAAEQQRRSWRHRREFGHETGVAALQAAQVADFVPSDVPPGAHLRAVTAYLKEHPPVWPARRRAPAPAAVRRMATAALKAAGRLRRVVRRGPPRSAVLDRQGRAETD